MSPRERTQVTSSYGGTMGRFSGDPGPGGGSDVVRSVSFCGDQTGPGDCAPFSVIKKYSDGGIINKPYTGFFASWFYDYVADVCRSLSLSHLFTDAPIDTAAATVGAARTNPSRPYVDVPVEALQLGELTYLLSRAKPTGRVGRDFVTGLGQGNLTAQFGVQPVVEDLVKLYNFQRQVSPRAQEIRKLQGSNGLRRTIDIGSWSAVEQQNLFVQTDGVFITGLFDVTTTERVRVHARWMPDGNYGDLVVPDVMASRLTRAMYGLTVDLSTVWELLPWSWLVDYFANVSQHLAASRNIVGAHLSDLVVMREIKTEAEWGGTSVDGATCSGITLGRHDKLRNLSFVSPFAGFPLLSANQLGIVASIGVTR